MKYKVLISSIHMQSRLDRYEDLLRSHGIEYDLISKTQFVPESDLLPIIDKYDGIICSDDELTNNVLEKAIKLRVISKWGTGINSIDQEAAKRLNIRIFNSPGAFTEGCATTAWSFILSLARHTHHLTNLMRENQWERKPGIALAGKTLGVIGVGTIGKEVLKRGWAFDMDLLGNDIKDVDKQFCEQFKIKMVSKEELLQQSDVISLNPDLNKSSHHLISDSEFERMKPTAFIINTSRGPVIDEKALIRALESKKIAGAGLDVFEEEPLPTDSPLRKFSNCILTPHNSFNTEEAVEKVHENTIMNLIHGLETHARF